MPTMGSVHGPTKRLPRSWYTLRFRLMLWYLLILGIVLCTFSAAIYVIEEHSLYQSLDSLLMTTLDQLAPSYDPQLGQVTGNNIVALIILENPKGQITQISSNMPPDALSALPRSFSQVQGWGNGPFWGNSESSTTSTASNGQVLSFTSSGAPVFAKLLDGQSSYAMQRFTIATRQNQLVGFMYIGVPSDLPDQLQQLLIALVVVTPLLLLLSSVGGYWLASRATRPVQTITRTAQEISATDLHRRLHLRQHDEIGELARTFDQMLDRLEAAFERQQQFTADASHELRTPLSIVTTEVERVLQRPHTAQEYVQALVIIHQEHQRMSRLVGDLLILARADQGHAVLKRERADLSEIVVDAAEALSALAEHHGIEIRLSGLDELVVWGDRLYLKHLCTNLLENAIKYSAGVGKQVEVHLDRAPHQARLQVIDEGPGIEAAHLPHLFERFYRVDSSRTHNLSPACASSPAGSGLGLSISRWIVREHGGSIQVRSVPGMGAVFEVCLPL
ncbi:MAG TPA: ATP-binding protein [Ktedonobacterales bacterium]|nr:ATP-binding protein [Ktedonobacterales bacterium]